MFDLEPDYYLSVTCLLEVQFVSIIGCYSCHRGGRGDCYIVYLEIDGGGGG